MAGFLPSAVLVCASGNDFGFSPDLDGWTGNQSWSGNECSGLAELLWV